jgi:hypothetical protein
LVVEGCLGLRNSSDVCGPQPLIDNFNGERDGGLSSVRGHVQEQSRMLLYEAKGIGELSNYIAPQYSDITISTNEGGEI